MGSAALIGAVDKDDIASVRRLIAQGDDVNSRDSSPEQLSALSLAIIEGKRDFAVAKFLVEHHADINPRDGKGYTPLHYACVRGQLALVEFLISHGASVNAQANSGWTPLDEAGTSAKIATVLRKHGATSGIPAVESAASNGDLRKILQLLQTGVDANAADRGGLTALFMAAGHGHLAIVKALVEHGASVTVANSQGMTALAYASEMGHSDIATYLQSHGAVASTGAPTPQAAASPSFAYCRGWWFGQQDGEYFSQAFPISGTADQELEQFKACIARLYPSADYHTATCHNEFTSQAEADQYRSRKMSKETADNQAEVDL
jgi:ankyrin repeat protein